MWMCFQRLNWLGMPQKAALFGEVVNCDYGSKVVLRCPFGEQFQEVTFRPDGRIMGHWRIEGHPMNVQYTISAVTPNRPMAETIISGRQVTTRFHE